MAAPISDAEKQQRRGHRSRDEHDGDDLRGELRQEGEGDKQVSAERRIEKRRPLCDSTRADLAVRRRPMQNRSSGREKRLLDVNRERFREG